MAGGRWRRSGGGRPQGSPLRVVRQRQRGGCPLTRWAPLDNPRPVSRGIRRGDFPVPPSSSSLKLPMPDARQERRRPRRRLGSASFRAPLGAACFTRRLGGACFRRPVFFARRGDFQSPTGRAVSSRPVGPIPDDRRGTPCGCPAGSHRPPAESPLHVAIPGARKDADPSRRLDKGRQTLHASPLHPPGPVVPRQWPADGGAVRGRATTRVAPATAVRAGPAAISRRWRSPRES